MQQETKQMNKLAPLSRLLTVQQMEDNYVSIYDINIFRSLFGNEVIVT